VMEGEYEVMNPEGSQIITRSEFASTVKPGTILEMNIILRKDSGFQANREKCPRPQCGYINLNAPQPMVGLSGKYLYVLPYRSLLNYPHYSRKCFAKFQVAEADDTDDIGHPNHSPRKRENPHGKKLGGGGSIEEIVSLASYVAHFLNVKLSLTIGDIIKS
jgi:hypothetical protein